jgi:hypothetical protein
MNARLLKLHWFDLLGAAVAAGLIIVVPAHAQAPADPKPAQDQPAAASPAPAVAKLPDGQIEQLVAPIALYPDALL